MEYSNSRNPYHDYTSKCIYLLTLNKSKEVMDFSRCFLDSAGVGECPGVIASSVGNAIKNALRRLQAEFPFVRVIRYIVMPDHLHLILEYLRKAEVKLGHIVAVFKVGIGKELGLKGVFAPGFHDRILRHKGQLGRMIHYVMDNPRRWLIRQSRRQYFSRPLLADLFGRQYVMYGNFLLLRNPVISQVRVSRSFSPEEMDRRRKEWEETIRANGVLVSPFISPAEKEIETKGIAEGAGIILIMREEIRERFKPSGRLFDLCAEGRLLLISTQKGMDSTKLSRQEAMAMNGLAENIANSPLPLLNLRPLSPRAASRPRPQQPVAPSPEGRLVPRHEGGPMPRPEGRPMNQTGLVDGESFSSKQGKSFSSQQGESPKTGKSFSPQQGGRPQPISSNYSNQLKP